MSGIPHWCHVGAKVVCVRAVEDVPANLAGVVSLPEVGRQYTVRATRFGAYDSEPCLQCIEIGNPSVRVEDDDLGVAWNGEPWFGIRLFKPLVTLSSDIATHFEHLLDVPASHEREGEPA